MVALGSFFGAVGNTINRFSTFTGGMIDTAIDGKFGIGTIHGGVLKIGKVCYDSRLVYLATQNIMADTVLDTKRKYCDELHGFDDYEKYTDFAILLTASIGVGAIYTLNATNCGFTQLTGAATKQMLAKTALTVGDGYALITSDRTRSSKTAKWTARAYLTARFADTLVNYGAVTQGLVRCNPQPLLSNMNWISSKIW